jgi:hypothetical protein
MDRFTADVKMQHDAMAKQIREQLPKYADKYERRLTELQRQFADYRDKDITITTSGRYSPDGTRLERRLNARALKTKPLATFTAETVDALDQQLAAQRAALVTPKKPKEPLEAILTELRHQEWRQELKKMDPLALQSLVRQTDRPELLDALDGSPVPLLPAEHVNEARIRLAEAGHPELGELATLRSAYQFAAGVVEQALLASSGLSPMELGTDPTTAPPPQQPYLVSSGERVTT